MKRASPITTLFLDVGGVMLTNGWDRHARKLAAATYKLDADEVESRHRMTFDTYEVGKITLDEYLHRVVFYEKRSFTPAQFRKFMFAQSKPFPDMIDLVRRLKTEHQLKIAVVNNEGRELNAYRFEKFKLSEFVDFYISSSYVHLRKPDADIFRMALDIAHVQPKHVMYIDDRMMFIQVAEDLGIRGIVHTDAKTTGAKLAALGLK